MTVLSMTIVGEVEEENNDGELMVTKSGKEFTLACNWPGCKEEFTGIQKRGFLRDAGWRYCGTGKQHLCPEHQHYSDEELETSCQ